VTFYDFSRRNLQTPQTLNKKSNPKQAQKIQQNNCFSSIRQQIFQKTRKHIGSDATSIADILGVSLLRQLEY
jgi:hypothetical protein